MILVAAITIIYTALKRFLNPAPLESLGIGLVISLVAAAIKFGVARFMFRKGEEYDSITLEADGHHLMTDVWTSVGVVAALVVMLVVPAWKWPDPLIALILGLNIIRTGLSLLKRSVAGLIDISLPHDEIDQIKEVLREKEGPDVVHHKLRTRKSASRRYVEFHLLMPQDITVKGAYDRCTGTEAEIRLRNFSHIYPFLSVTSGTVPLGWTLGMLPSGGGTCTLFLPESPRRTGSNGWNSRALAGAPS